MQDVNSGAEGTTARKAQVHRFYEVLWDAHDRDTIRSVVHDDFVFRGSLGDETQGHKGFAKYVDMVHTALGDYRCTIEVVVEEGEKVFAKMSFGGVHRARFMGYEPSGQPVHWTGYALFTFRGKKSRNTSERQGSAERLCTVPSASPDPPARLYTARTVQTGRT